MQELEPYLSSDDLRTYTYDTFPKCSCNKHLLNTYYKSGILLHTKDTVELGKDRYLSKPFQEVPIFNCDKFQGRKVYYIVWTETHPRQ